MLDGANATVYSSYGPERVDTPAHRALAQLAAEEAIVLLQNTNGVLPLAAGTKVAVVRVRETV